MSDDDYELFGNNSFLALDVQGSDPFIDFDTLRSIEQRNSDSGSPSSSSTNPKELTESRESNKKRRRTESTNFLFSGYLQNEWFPVVNRNNQPVSHLFTTAVEVTKPPALDPEEGSYIHYRRNQFRMSVEVQKDAIASVQQHNARVTLFNGQTPQVKGLKVSVIALANKSLGDKPPFSSQTTLETRSEGGKTNLQPVAISNCDILSFNFYFNASTANNGQRQRTKSSPNAPPLDPSKLQEYFYLTVNLLGVLETGQECLLHSSISPAIIVRGGNPSAYNNTAAPKEPNSVIKVEKEWKSGIAFNAAGIPAPTLTTNSNVGINCQDPTEALTVYGNIQMTGNLLKPSDRRIKSDIVPKDNTKALETLKQVKLYNYKREDLATGQLISETGVIAQELQTIIPDAVKNTGDKITPSGNKIDDMLVVDERSIMYENIAATQELDTKIERIEDRVQDLEEGTLYPLVPTRNKTVQKIACLAIIFILGVTVVGLLASTASSYNERSQNDKPLFAIPIQANIMDIAMFQQEVIAAAAYGSAQRCPHSISDANMLLIMVEEPETSVPLSAGYAEFNSNSFSIVYGNSDSECVSVGPHNKTRLCNRYFGVPDHDLSNIIKNQKVDYISFGSYEGGFWVPSCKTGEELGIVQKKNLYCQYALSSIYVNFTCNANNVYQIFFSNVWTDNSNYVYNGGYQNYYYNNYYLGYVYDAYKQYYR